ncbi:adenosylcobinamide amidohydrolase [Ammoniphilus sp. 3BR4]|uniref:adenosylcobinamide amidohydrolase n=1 Tax=Ammoniphilus sp. 3BR4 TaxID=3158265 RepID=UPI003466CA9C
MAQPFQWQANYRSQVWPDISIDYKIDHVLIRSRAPLASCSSALWGGGLAHARYFFNGFVSHSYQSDDPQGMIKAELARRGYPLGETVGLLTAAKLANASIHEEAGDQFRLVCCATAGTGNAARAGMARQTFPAYQFGTINILIMLDGRLSSSAIINGIMTASEAKAAALQDLQICDAEGRIATGTTSDAIVLAASQQGKAEHEHQFAGTATTVGNAIGRLVYQSVYEAVATQGR